MRRVVALACLLAFAAAAPVEVRVLERAAG